MSGSLSLVADAFHMLSDALALIIGLVTIFMSKRTSTKNTYGWIRAEVLGPLVNSVFLVSMCLSILIKAIQRLFEPEPLEDINLLLCVGAIGLLINLLGLFVFGHGHSHNISHDLDQDMEDDEDGVVANGDKEMVEKNLLVKSDQAAKKSERKKKKKTCCSILSSEANMNMRAVFLHVLADALGSVIVIISGLVNKFQNELSVSEKMANLIDPVLCLCQVTLILCTAIPLLKESGLILLQTVPKDIEVAVLKQDLINHVPEISNVHELHVWKLTGHKIIATAHVVCHNEVEYMKIAARIKSFFHKKGIHSTTIQPEFTDLLSGQVPENVCLMECMTACVENTCCGSQPPLIVKNKSVSSQLKRATNICDANEQTVELVTVDNSTV